MSAKPIRTAVLLAAGAGTRFWPYNVVRQKAAFPIANVPALRRTVDALLELGLSRIVVVVGHGEPSVRAALRGAAGQIRYVRQPALEGTASAALLGAQGLEEDLLVVAGDVVTDPQNLSALLSRFAAHRPLAATLIQPLGQERPHDWIAAFPDGEVSPYDDPFG